VALRRALGRVAAALAIALSIPGVSIVAPGLALAQTPAQTAAAPAAGKGSGGALQLERRVVATVPDAASNFTL
jgi:hypothetical protein